MRCLRTGVQGWTRRGWDWTLLLPEISPNPSILLSMQICALESSHLLCGNEEPSRAICRAQE